MKEEKKEKMKAMAGKLFRGEITLKKMDLWLIGAVCLFAGIVYGLRKAPWTHGVMIGSNNGSHNKDNNNHNKGSLGTKAGEDTQKEEEQENHLE